MFGIAAQHLSQQNTVLLVRLREFATPPIAVIRPHFEEARLRLTPLIDRFLHHVLPLPKLKSHGRLSVFRPE
jgi:hypothetical protein